LGVEKLNFSRLRCVCHLLSFNFFWQLDTIGSSSSNPERIVGGVNGSLLCLTFSMISLQKALQSTLGPKTDFLLPPNQLAVEKPHRHGERNVLPSWRYNDGIVPSQLPLKCLSFVSRSACSVGFFLKPHFLPELAFTFSI
jgi:hypothetical protein